MSPKKLMDKKGVAVVFLALAIIVIFGFAALAIDIGHIYHVKDQLQAAADSAALAGAGELAGPDDTTKTANAKEAAVRLAAKNKADVATVTGIPTANPGDPIPVTLDPANDIQVGNWDGTNFHPGTDPLNAVRVFAKRTGARADQPRASNWFARIFALLGSDFDFTAITAGAIAARTPLLLLPIAVNEYWNESVDNSGVPLPGDPYGQKYPESFMRSINADGSTNGRGGQKFAVLGTRANDNNAPAKNLNSYVDILFRNRFHTPILTNPTLSDNGDPIAWYSVNQGADTGTCSPSCVNNLTDIPTGVKSSINNGRFDIDANFGFLFTGIPDNTIPPNAVREIIRPSPFYPLDNYNNCPDINDCNVPVGNNSPNNNDPSNCPFASIPYFTSSGGDVVNKTGPAGKDFRETWPTGTRFMVMVYDGTVQANPDPSQANVVTVIGYGIIEIDGYTSGNIKNVSDFNGLNPGGPGSNPANTAYGHAIKHGVAGQTDQYLIQPPDSPANQTTGSARKGNCSFTDILRTTRDNFGGVKLVGVSPNVRYGTKD